MVATKLWTVEEVAQLPDDEYRYALIRGVLYRMPPIQSQHGIVTSRIVRWVGNVVEEHDLGEVYDQSGFVFERDPDVMLGPDLSFVRRDRTPPTEGYPELAPDLVVEVVSPSQSGPSIEEKTVIYLDAGVRMVWAVDPIRRTVRVRRPDGTDRLLTEADTFDGEDVLPGFRVPVARLFVGL